MSNEKKETLLKQLHDANWEVFYKVHNGVAHGDLVGNDDVYYYKALEYVPNHILKKWIKDSKTEVKQHEEGENENPTRT